MGDIKSFVSLVEKTEKAKSEKPPYFIFSSASGSVAGLQASDWINTSGTYSSERMRASSIYGAKSERIRASNFRIELKKVQPEPIKAWVMSRHIAYFDPGTSTYHIVSMAKPVEKQWLTTLVFNVMSIFV